MNLKKSIIYNTFIFILVVFSIVSMLIGFHFMTPNAPLSAANLSMFRFYTVDSNVLAGIVSLLMVIVESKKKEIPNWLMVLKLISTSAITLTMIVTICFLSPQYGRNFYILFMNSNLFMHLIIPVLCIRSFVKVEKSNIPFKTSFLGLLPMVFYAIYYCIQAFPHAINNQIPRAYDWYGFFMFGANTVWIVIGIFFIFMYLISYILWKWNKK